MMCGVSSRFPCQVNLLKENQFQYFGVNAGNSRQDIIPQGTGYRHFPTPGRNVKAQRLLGCADYFFRQKIMRITGNGSLRTHHTRGGRGVSGNSFITHAGPEGRTGRFAQPCEDFKKYAGPGHEGRIMKAIRCPAPLPG